jgi:hypothetical protein
MVVMTRMQTGEWMPKMPVSFSFWMFCHRPFPSYPERFVVDGRRIVSNMAAMYVPYCRRLHHCSYNLLLLSGEPSRIGNLWIGYSKTCFPRIWRRKKRKESLRIHIFERHLPRHRTLWHNTKRRNKRGNN